MCLLSFHRKKGPGLERGLGGEEYKLDLQRTQVQQTEGLRSGVHTGCVPAKFKPNLFTVSITFLAFLRISHCRVIKTLLWAGCHFIVSWVHFGSWCLWSSLCDRCLGRTTSLKWDGAAWPPYKQPFPHALIPTHLSSWRPYFRNPHLSSKRGCLSPDGFNVDTWDIVHYCIRVHFLWPWSHSIEEKTIWTCQRQAVS